MLQIGGIVVLFACVFGGYMMTGGSLGGETGRRIQFWPASGRAMQKLVRAVEEKPLANPVLPTAGELELF